MSDVSSAGSIHPDGDVPGAVPGSPELREDVVGGALAPDAGDSATASSTQDEPAMDMHEASVDDKIAGIVAQTRVDVAGEDAERITEVLRQRFVDTGIDVSDADRAALAERIASGS